MSAGRATSGLRGGGKLVGRVDVAERVRLVVERDFDDLECRLPRVDLPSSAFEKRGEARQDIPAHQRKHRDAGWSNVFATASCARSRRAPLATERRDPPAGTASRRAR
jgi:hypothetical protein